MEWRDLLVDGYDRVQEFIENVLRGLPQEDLDWQPSSDCNSIGWLVWHLARQQDMQIASLMGKEQLWIQDGWHSRFNRDEDPYDIGFGHSLEQVAVFKSPDIKTMLGYHHAVKERSKQYFTTLSSTDLDREIDEPWFQPKPTVGVRLISILEDGLLHAGQAAYIRGLRHGKGWQPY
ncbi:MAG: DinB family protein [Chloroflexota bacterium]|nr:DinB family protein [Chloroflexota bacterium]